MFMGMMHDAHSTGFPFFKVGWQVEVLPVLSIMAFARGTDRDYCSLLNETKEKRYLVRFCRGPCLSNPSSGGVESRHLMTSAGYLEKPAPDLLCPGSLWAGDVLAIWNHHLLSHDKINQTAPTKLNMREIQIQSDTHKLCQKNICLLCKECHGLNRKCQY